MLFEVVMYGSDDKEVASAVVEAADRFEAQETALRIIRGKYPAIDPAIYNRTMATPVLFRGSTP